MGIIKRGILGGFSGSVANVVGSSWKGISTMRSKPLSVANPRTAAQVGNRTRFKAVTVLASEMLSGVIKPLWDRFAVQESGYNTFQRANKDVFGDTGVFDAASLKIAQGKMEAPAELSCVLDSPGTIMVNWSTILSDAYAMDSDLAYIAVLNEDGNVLAIGSGETTRDTGTTTLSNSEFVETAQIKIYLAFRRADGTVVSNTTFLAKTLA
jgi:hypothetical protein